MRIPSYIAIVVMSLGLMFGSSTRVQAAWYDTVQAVDTDTAAYTGTGADTDWQPIAEQVQEIRLQLRDGHLELDADIDFDLNPELRELATKGVPLYFTAELELFRPRSWWFDETVLKTQRTWKLMYNALTRQWRIGTGELLLPEASLHDALERIRQLRGWALLSASALPEGTYYGRLRLQLDTSLLAKPIKVESLNRNAWSLGTPWKDFRFSIDAAS